MFQVAILFVVTLETSLAHIYAVLLVVDVLVEGIQVADETVVELLTFLEK